MSYVVFARKWRPQTFNDVVGQEHITETLKKAIEKNRVAHAFIFTGTRGVGKTTTARIMARALNCEKGPTINPCGECTSCKNILSGASFDVLEIDGASNNGVDDIRELRENIGYSSMGGKYRIYVIDEVHMLTKAAFNALLKTLEEPPKNVIFIFATTEPQKIPATIHSRCQRYDFKRIGAEQILGYLVDICTTENIKFEKSALMLVARKADGSMRDSLSLLDQVYSFCQDNLTEKEVRKVLGLVGLDVFNTVMDAVASKNAAPALGAVQDVLYQGFDLQEFLLGLQEHIRNLLFARIPGAIEARGVEIEPEAAVELRKSAERFTEGDLLRMSEIVRKAESELKWSAFSRFHVEITILKLVFLDRTVSIDQLVELASRGVPPENIASLVASTLQNASVPAGDTDLKKKLNDNNSPELSPIEPDNYETNTIEITSHDVNSVACHSVASEIIETGSDNASDNAGLYDDTSDLTDDTDVDDTDDECDIPVRPHVQPLQTEAKPESGTFDDTPLVKEIQDPCALWTSFVDFMLKDRPNVGSFLAMSYLSGATGTSLDVRFPSSYRFQFVETTKKHNRDLIENLLYQFTGSKYELHITLETTRTDAQERQLLHQLVAMPLSINDEMDREPIIKTILDIFDGEVLN
jgi:DNA polymerase-3 subunit gamma/tau